MRDGMLDEVVATPVTNRFDPKDATHISKLFARPARKPNTARWPSQRGPVNAPSRSTRRQECERVRVRSASSGSTFFDFVTSLWPAHTARNSGRPM